MKRKEIIWPVLINEGGWRQQRLDGAYWPRYVRYHKGRKQLIRHFPAGLCWALYESGKLRAYNSLTPLLKLADTPG